MSPPLIFDRDLLTRRRDRAARGAPQHAFLLERVTDDFLERLGAVNRAFTSALDLGCHHGHLGRALASRPGLAMVVSCDPSPAMLALAPMPKVNADEEAMPFRAGAFDLVVSGLALHLVNDLPGVLVQIRQALKPDGLMLAALLGGRSLQELRAAVLEAECETEGGASPRVAPAIDIRDLGRLMQRAGFALPAVDSDLVTVTWGSALDMIREIKAMGASNMLAERSRRPMTRRLLARACALYEERHRDRDGRIPATFEILTLTGWCPHESQQQPLRPGSGRTPLADVLKPPR